MEIRRIRNKAHMFKVLREVSQNNLEYVLYFHNSGLTVHITGKGKERRKMLSIARTRLSKTEAIWFRERSE